MRRLSALSEEGHGDSEEWTPYSYNSEAQLLAPQNTSIHLMKWAEIEELAEEEELLVDAEYKKRMNHEKECLLKEIATLRVVNMLCSC